MTTVERSEGFGQVCIWPGTLIEEKEIPTFEAWMQEKFGVRVQYLETIETKSDLDDSGFEVPGTGGRHDVFFAIHGEDIGKFAIPRLSVGIRWLEDAISGVNGGNRLYPERVTEYVTWKTDPTDESETSENVSPENLVPGTSIKKPKVKLVGEDGNAFAVMGKVVRGLRRAKVPSSVIEAYKNESVSGDYDNVLATAAKYAEVG